MFPPHARPDSGTSSIFDHDLAFNSHLTTAFLYHDPTFLFAVTLIVQYVLRVELLSRRPERPTRWTTTVRSGTTAATTTIKCIPQYAASKLWGSSSSATEFHRLSNAAPSHGIPAPAAATADGIRGSATTISIQSSSSATEFPNRRSPNASDAAPVPESEPSPAAADPYGATTKATADRLRADSR